MPWWWKAVLGFTAWSVVSTLIALGIAKVLGRGKGDDETGDRT